MQYEMSNWELRVMFAAIYDRVYRLCEDFALRIDEDSDFATMNGRTYYAWVMRVIEADDTFAYVWGIGRIGYVDTLSAEVVADVDEAERESYHALIALEPSN